MNRSKKRNIKSNSFLNKFITFYPFVILLLILLYVSRGFIFKEGYILYGEYLSSNNYLLYLKNFLMPWEDYTTLGHSNIGFPTRYGLSPTFFISPVPLLARWLFYNLILQFAFPFFYQKLYILVSLILPFAGMYFFSRYWFRSLQISKFTLNSLAFICGLIYTFNAYIGYRVFAGHIFYNYGYGLFPLMLLLIFIAVEKKGIQNKSLYTVLIGLLISILFWVMPHILYILPLVILVYFITNLLFKPKKIITLITILSIASFIGFILHIDSWLPALFYKEFYPLVDNSFYNLNAFNQSTYSATFKSIISQMSGTEFFWTKSNVYEYLSKWRLILPIMAVIGFILNLVFIKERRRSIFIFLISVFALLFMMGINSPLKEINVFLYKNSFLFKPFRDPSKFFMLYIFGIAIFTSYFFYFISKISKKIFFIFIILFPIYIIYSHPIFFSGNFGKTIIPFNYPKKYDVLRKFLSEKKGDFRVAIYPNDTRMGDYDWYPKSTTNGSPYYNIFTTINPLDKSLANSNRTISDLSSRYLDYLENNLDQSWAIDRLINEKTKYFIVDHSLANYKLIENKLAKNSRLKLIKQIKGFSVFEVKDFNLQSIKKTKAVYYHGDTQGIKYLPSNLALIDLGWNDLNVLKNDYSNFIFLYNKSLDDIFLNSLKKFRVSFFPEVRFLPEDFIIPGDYLRPLIVSGNQFYNPEIIFTPNSGVISKKIDLKKGTYKIFANVFTSADDTSWFTISINNKVYKKDIPKIPDKSFVWVNFGEINIKDSNNIITVNNFESKPLTIDSLIIIPAREYNTLKKEFNLLVKNIKIYEIKENNNINNLKIDSPNIYSFSQSYSPYWNYCNSQPFLVNFFGSGFRCDINTNSQPIFKPSSLYYLSSTAALILNTIVIIYIFVKRKSL